MWSASPFYLAADCELPNDSKPERQLVTLTTIVAVPCYKTVHICKVKEKVKQVVPPFEWAPSNCVSFSSLVETIYSSHYWILLCKCDRARNNQWCIISILSFYLSDLLVIAVRGQNCHRFVVLPLYCCHTSFSPEHELSSLQQIFSLENIWKPLPASSNRTHGIKTPFFQSFQELIRSEKILKYNKSMAVDVCVTQA